MPTKKEHQCLKLTTSYPSLVPCWQGATQQPLPGIWRSLPWASYLTKSPENSLGQALLSLPEWPMVCKNFLEAKQKSFFIVSLNLNWVFYFSNHWGWCPSGLQVPVSCIRPTKNPSSVWWHPSALRSTRRSLSCCLSGTNEFTLTTCLGLPVIQLVLVDYEWINRLWCHTDVHMEVSWGRLCWTAILM